MRVSLSVSLRMWNHIKQLHFHFQWLTCCSCCSRKPQKSLFHNHGAVLMARGGTKLSFNTRFLKAVLQTVILPRTSFCRPRQIYSRLSKQRVNHASVPITASGDTQELLQHMGHNTEENLKAETISSHWRRQKNPSCSELGEVNKKRLHFLAKPSLVCSAKDGALSTP